MTSRMLTAMCALLLCTASMAADIPAGWSKYRSNAYISSIEQDERASGQTDAEFKKQLTERAIANVAKQIQVRVKDEAQMSRTVNDGHSTQRYKASTSYSTDVELKFVKTDFTIIGSDGYALAYIDKREAIEYYMNAARMLIGKAEHSLSIAKDLISAQTKNKAKVQLESASSELAGIDENLYWLNVFGAPKADITSLSSRRDQLDQEIGQTLLSMSHSTRLHVTSTASIYGKNYTPLAKSVMGKMPNDGYSFVDSPADSDWIIKIKASTEEYNNPDVKGMQFFISYVNAEISITSAKDGKRILEDAVRIKGAHSVSYEKAAEAAYNNVANELSKIIIQTIDK